MGKANKAKKELVESKELNFLVQTLKDIADNKYYSMIAQKEVFKRFGQSFSEFFRLMSQIEVEHPLLHNENTTVGFVVVTIEGTFLSGFNNKIVDLAIKEMENYEKVKFVVIGRKVVDRLKVHDPDVKVFPPMDEAGMYETAIQVKDYLTEEVMEGRLGKVLVFYSWAKSLEIQKVRAIKLLPCDELLSKQADTVEVIEKVIRESEPKEVIAYLSNLWIISKLYEHFIDTNIASAAAQVTLLEGSAETMKKEVNASLMKYRKARKMDIDKGLQETFAGMLMAS